MDVKLVIDGKVYVFGESNRLPCYGCAFFTQCGEDETPQSNAVTRLCSSLGNRWRVVSISSESKPATLNYPCGSMGEEIEQ